MLDVGEGMIVLNEEGEQGARGSTFGLVSIGEPVAT
jgi:hypothetical protein